MINKKNTANSKDVKHIKQGDPERKEKEVEKLKEKIIGASSSYFKENPDNLDTHTLSTLKEAWTLNELDGLKHNLCESLDKIKEELDNANNIVRWIDGIYTDIYDIISI